MSANPEQEDPKWEFNIPFTSYKICTSSRFWYSPPPLPFFAMGIEIPVIFVGPVFILSSYIPLIKPYESYIMLGATSIMSWLVGASAEWRYASASIATPMTTILQFTFMVFMKYKFDYLKSFVTLNTNNNDQTQWYLYGYLFWWYLCCGAVGTGSTQSAPYKIPIGFPFALFENLILSGWQKLLCIVKRDYNGSPIGRNYWILSIIILSIHGYIANKCATDLYELYRK